MCSEVDGEDRVSSSVEEEESQNLNERLRSLCKMGDGEELRGLLRNHGSRVDIDGLSVEGWTCLHEVITHECQFLNVARILVEEGGGKVNTQDAHGDSPLHSTLLYHNADNAKLLLQNGADLNLVNALGRYPIHVADDPESLSLIINHDPSEVDRQDRNGNTPLHFAVVSKDKERVSLLIISHSANVNIQNSSGSSPLHLVNGDLEIAKSLLASGGADPNLPDASGNTPLHLSVRGRNKDVDKEMKRILAKKSITSPFTLTINFTAKKATTIKSPPIIDKILLPEKPNTPGILRKRKRTFDPGEEEPLRKGPRLTFNEVVDYSGVDNVENEKRVKIPPIYVDPPFSSDED
ncbi:unnamed protein product [Lepeophtheirus salmonis]|uniref:(salmon louse) hypothetical protein n=1 Tax=Lepeophtheirus salmonis TaxID=72036 RepID=A0A7R8CC71_LEPSM|nr:unnamed protein product [Lepeophtheirus salmonis]CAF2768132.1 unnamed protein product [Lepeophtheirus salmonis]